MNTKADAVNYRDLAGLDAPAVRDAIRSGAYCGHTAGLALGRLQCNLVILPREFAADFARYCQRNPKPCPLAAASEPGDPSLPALGTDIDVRCDAPSYNVYRDGALAETHGDIRDLWRDDLVCFALGCSFTFERALTAAGFTMRHIELGRTVPMFRANIQTRPSGPFGGEMVVSMRPLPAGRVDEAADICRRFPGAHGAPVHSGDPSAIGIADIAKPDWGDAVDVNDGETPAFWACGVTPQNAVLSAAIPFCVSHTPGCMLITDAPEDAGFPVAAASDSSAAPGSSL